MDINIHLTWLHLFAGIGVIAVFVGSAWLLAELIKTIMFMRMDH